MFLTLVNPDPLCAHVELASCLLVESACSVSDLESYLDEAGWHIRWALKIICTETRPDPLAIAALNELLPIYQSMSGFTPTALTLALL
jgi:hypothetical protein